MVIVCNMARTCFVPMCKTGHKGQKKEKISLFRVPKNKLAEWQKVVPRRRRALSDKDMICEKHFLKEYICREINNELFVYPLGHPKLTLDAIPTIFPGCTFPLTKKPTKRRLIQEHELSKTKLIKLEQEAPDISMQEENEAEVAVHNSSEILEVRNNFEFKAIPPDTIFLTTNQVKLEPGTPVISTQNENEAEGAVQNTSEVLEFEDNLEFKDNFEFTDNLVTILPTTPKFISEQVTPVISTQVENKAKDAVQNSSEVLEFKDNFKFKDNLLDTILPTTKKLISEQVTPVISIQDENYKDIRQEPIFFEIFKNISIILLPSAEWAIHMYVNKYAKDVDRGLICFSEMIQIIEDNNMIVRKKLVLSKDAIKIFVFDHMIDNNVIFSNENVNTLAELQDGLNKFNNLPVCWGGLPIRDLQSDFKNPLYFEDHHLNVWRHVACSYILPTVKDEKRFGEKFTCSYCKKSTKAVLNFKYNLAKSANKTTRVQKALKNAANVRKREKKLSIKNEEIMQELKCAQKKLKELEEDTFEDKINTLNVSASQRLLLQECINSSKHNQKTSRRYSTEWLLICSLLQIRSPVTYRFLIFNDILSVPSVSTIKKYLSTISIKCGLDEKFFEGFRLKMLDKNEYERHGILIFNEMQVGEALNLNIKAMKLYGIPNFGEKNVDTIKANNIKRAHHSLVFMFVSLASTFCQPIVIYTTEKPITSTRIAQLILEVIKNLENNGAVIDGVVSKGATTNRKIWAEFGISGDIEGPVNRIKHPFNDSRFLHFFSDAPHLIKCLRNRLLKKSVLQTPDGIVRWSFYEKLFYLDKQLSANLRVCPKITEMHINPSDLDKKRVNLAAQIFSNSVADGLDNYKQNNKDFINSEGTINFTRRINYLYDALNRRDPIEGIKLESKDFEVLEKNLIYLNSWENMLVKGEIKTTEFLTKYTTEGLRVTILSTIDLAKHLLNCGFQYVLSGKFNQDPLEVARTR